MITITDNNITYYLPEKVAFLFNPCLVRAEGVELAKLEVEVHSTAGLESYKTCKVEAYNGRCVADIREYAKALFFPNGISNVNDVTDVAESDFDMYAALTIKAYDSEGKTISTIGHNTLIVWGSLRAGEVFNEIKHLTYFRNYPFTFGIWMNSAATLIINDNTGGTTKIDLTKVDAIDAIVNISDSKLSKYATRYVVCDTDGIVEQATFDKSFNLTFYKLVGEKQSEIMTIDVDDSNEGVYLRWIDRHGFYKYWLFQRGTDSRSVSTDGEYIRNNLWDWDETFGFLGVNGRRQRYTREDSIAICAAHVDSDTFDMLQDIASSPIVDMWTGENWVSVAIKAGTYTKSTQTYQDFEANIICNDIPLQSL